MSIPTSTAADPAVTRKPIVWTAWLQYFATGEGEALMACIAYARTADEMRGRFAKIFGEYYARGCELSPGVVRNHITQVLWSSEALQLIEQAAQRGGAVTAHSWLHRNFS